jgi:hypothetical protein
VPGVGTLAGWAAAEDYPASAWPAEAAAALRQLIHAASQIRRESSSRSS